MRIAAQATPTCYLHVRLGSVNPQDSPHVIVMVCMLAWGHTEINGIGDGTITALEKWEMKYTIRKHSRQNRMWESFGSHGLIDTVVMYS